MDGKVGKIVGSSPKMDHAGSDVHLTITSTCLKLTSLDTGAVIASHDMPNISFASGGDEVCHFFSGLIHIHSFVMYVDCDYPPKVQYYCCRGGLNLGN